MARPSKFNDETIAKLTQAIQLGSTFALACKYAQISERTFYEWMANKPQFSQAIKEAEGKAAITWLAKIEKAASEGTWQAAAWKLERRYPNEYGRSRDAKIDVTTHESSIDTARLTKDQLSQLESILVYAQIED